MKQTPLIIGVFIIAFIIIWVSGYFILQKENKDLQKKGKKGWSKGSVIGLVTGLSLVGASIISAFV